MTKLKEECPVCGKRFRGKKGLKMHLRDVHDVTKGTEAKADKEAEVAS